MTEIAGFYSFLTDYLWPLITAYAVWLHKTLATQSQAISAISADIAKNYVTNPEVRSLEDRVVGMLNRIDDKVNRLLERTK